MEHKKYEQIARDEAKCSQCLERQVGAILVDNATGDVVSQGHNYSNTCDCNITYLNHRTITCAKDVIHAEVECIYNLNIPFAELNTYHFTMYITQPPCNDCIKKIQEFTEAYECPIDIKICEQFLKFDDDKLRYDLIPPEWETELAKVLTYGAKKYKPNNWRKGEIERYKGAVMRHWNAYRCGEALDPETQMMHLSHMFTNIGFLITLEAENED